MLLLDKINELKKIVAESSSIVFFGGAGVSTESNIPDFRSENGLYKTKNNFSYPPEVMLSHTFFKNHTEDFFEFYREKMIFKDAKPNAAHYSLAKIEEQGKLKAIVTQNIDGLHQLAGSKNVYELHGSIHRNYCMDCGKSFDLEYVIKSETTIPKCDKCGGIVKPDVVLYEEGLDDSIIQNSVKAISEADTLIVGGTSLVVYPAAGLIRYFKGNKLILINKSATAYDNEADLVISDSIGKVLETVI
ncbi:MULTISPECIES: NAD-dependent protein deacylase [Clostridium]|uniref:NAD-dependent protein deacetylase n=1 Tax=Clostridium acetobutylicum (strain ATCC 824 / DSM 792 / JCM 1419 / IAM 19013 / LMG 5710 / NBRC 13948 / NRRL B-527 / VKM B-1787 / 2291 / W) TaxID=272562 RepID=NPD_CLOAB|nr:MULTISPECIES: NAD-dependent protein deacylase [Clostridium]Q97MB4.1 RecName: Full=NAD-dependent protein deacetylase; AltName: Full=Regulatory protein SIR2 homolog [Clostridium acetobutylicum ATCC 824]AAK78265.1 Transcriptional regulatory protein, Sir2 family [Clostridium acetobutylicum ATCC 824]AEI34605.1 NAD-dependent deacetylase [Clostridium acetobutylicum DSM 1731]AWV82115.1 NAD-dependent protein deacetylase [Clostridium acetobutylicum]AWV82164.1 NAD-dependent protein deacetylase [Clostr